VADADSNEPRSFTDEYSRRLARPIRLLVVEDNAGDILLIRKALSSELIHVDTAGSLSVALRKVESETWDVILLDLHLPDSRGMETVKALSRRAGSIPILVMSGTGRQGLESLGHGAVDHLVKSPAMYSALPRVLRFALERSVLAQRAAHLDRLALMGRIAAGTAHELSNPASFIALNQELLAARLRELREEAPQLASGLDECLEMVEENRIGLERMRKLLSDMGRFSRSDSVGKMTPIDLHSLVEDVARLMKKPLAERARLRVLNDEVPAIRGDEHRLQQVLTNLLINARDATPVRDEHPEILLTCRAYGDEVEICVCDEGEGMSDEVLARAFEPFFTTKGPGGTGLGLALSAEIVHQHGGSLDVDSEPGRGTTFRLRFPTEAARDSILPEGPARLLLIDDDVTVLRAFQRALSTDHEVVAVSTVEAACEALTDGPYALVLSDVTMPAGGGQAVYEHATRVAPALAEQIVFVTGGLTDPRVRRFCESVPNRVLYKPVDVALVRRLVRNAVEQQRMGSGRYKRPGSSSAAG